MKIEITKYFVKQAIFGKISGLSVDSLIRNLGKCFCTSGNATATRGNAVATGRDAAAVGETVPNFGGVYLLAMSTAFRDG